MRCEEYPDRVRDGKDDGIVSSAAQFMAESAIDVHGHCGEYGGYNDLTARLMNASAEVVCPACGPVRDPSDRGL